MKTKIDTQLRFDLSFYFFPPILLVYLYLESLLPKWVRLLTSSLSRFYTDILLTLCTLGEMHDERWSICVFLICGENCLWKDLVSNGLLWFFCFWDKFLKSKIPSLPAVFWLQFLFPWWVHFITKVFFCFCTVWIFESEKLAGWQAGRLTCFIAWFLILYVWSFRLVWLSAFRWSVNVHLTAKRFCDGETSQG